MAEAKDPAIKLFGKTIAANVDVIHDELSSSHNYYIHLNNKASPQGDQDGNSCYIKEPGVHQQGSDKNASYDPPLRTADNPESLSGANEATKPSKSEEEKEETLKKPDKILPCPRCKSMDTKFCYYNNYNLNQPRHFCRNCQRYWTAGGNMRNVPVGAGRRKNKTSASNYRHITVPETPQISRTDIPNSGHPGMQTNGTILTFGSDSPLCESMVSILNLAEKRIVNTTVQNGFQKPEELKIQIPFVAIENGGNLNGSNLENATKSSPKELPAQNCLPYPNAFWHYPWNSAQWVPPVAGPPFCPNGVALPYYPAPAYWGCTVPGTWSIPLIPQPSPATQSCPSSGPNSPTLGKHSRDGNMLKSTSSDEKEPEGNGGQSLWIPKTLRIDDPREAAKSSIWTTLGIKHNEKPGSIGRGSGLFKAFQSKCEERSPNLETSTIMEANPAALSRSHNFQENS